MNDETKPRVRFAIANVAFLRSDNGRDGWVLIEPHDVPAFVRDPDRLGRMLERREAAMDTAGDQRWYFAMRLDTPAPANDGPEAPAAA